MMHFAPLAWVYFTVALTALAIALLSARSALIWTALIMLCSWLMSNEAVNAYGYPGFIKAVAIYDGILAMGVAGIGVPLKSKPLAIVFGLFLAEETIHVAFLASVAASSMFVTRGLVTCYVVCLNAIFLAQCVTIGAAGVRAGLVDCGSSGNSLVSCARQRWAFVVAALARGKAQGQS